MKFGEMDPMHVPARPSGLSPRDPAAQEPDLQPCVACGEPTSKRWCSDACRIAEDGPAHSDLALEHDEDHRADERWEESERDYSDGRYGW